MKRVSVNSSHIDSLEYNDETQVLKIRFKNGSIYEYSDVPVLIFERFAAATSVGQFFHLYIKDKYPMKRIL